MNSRSNHNEGIRVLDEFVCQAIPDPSVSAPGTPQGENDGSGLNPQSAEIYLQFSFEEPDQSRAGVYAQELRQFILDRAPRAQVALTRTNPSAMDLGSVVTVAITTLIVRAVFEAARVWLMVRRKPLRIQVGDRTFIIDQLTPEMQAEITRLLQPSPPPPPKASP